MLQPEEEPCSPGVATRLAKRRSMDGAVPSTPPSSGKGTRRDAPSDYRGDGSGALDAHAATNVPRRSSGAHPEPTDEEMHDRSPSESCSVSSDEADAREDVAAVAREAAVDRKVRVLILGVCDVDALDRCQRVRRVSLFPLGLATANRRSDFFSFFFFAFSSTTPPPPPPPPPLPRAHVLIAPSCLQP